MMGRPLLPNRPHGGPIPPARAPFVHSLSILWVLGLLSACVSAPVPSTSLTSYTEAKALYASALERDLRAAGFPTARLVPIPPAIEPYKPGAAFKPGSVRPVSHACIVSEQRMPEPKKVRELWPAGRQPQFSLATDVPDMVAVAAQQVLAVQRATTLKQPAMVSLADTTQVSLETRDLLPALRNEACLDALVATDVIMVQGIIYGAEAVSNSRYLEVGAREETLQNQRYRVRSDASGGFYLQETKVRPKYWIVSGLRLELKVDRDVATPEQRSHALKTYVASKGGDLEVRERALSDREVRAFNETLQAASVRKSVR